MHLSPSQVSHLLWLSPVLYSPPPVLLAPSPVFPPLFPASSAVSRSHLLANRCCLTPLGRLSASRTFPPPSTAAAPQAAWARRAVGRLRPASPSPG